MRLECRAHLLQRLVESRTADAEVVAWLVDGFGLWLQSGGGLPLTASLGLPAKAVNVQKLMRNGWLVEAAAMLPGGVWQRAEQLRVAARRYAVTKWPRWRAMPLPPPEATRLETCLHFAFRAIPVMPRSVQAFVDIIESSQAKTEENLGSTAA